MGGDGTVNEAVNGVAGAGALGEIRFGIIPLGTGNDFAAGLGIPADVDAALEVLAQEEPLTLTEIAQRLRRTPGSTKDYLSWLEDVDLIVSGASGSPA